MSSISSVVSTAATLAALEGIAIHSTSEMGSLFSSFFLNSNNCDIVSPDGGQAGYYYTCMRASKYTVAYRSAVNTGEFAIDHFARSEPERASVGITDIIGGVDLAGAGTSNEQKLRALSIPMNNFLGLRSNEAYESIVEKVRKHVLGLQNAMIDGLMGFWFSAIEANHYIKKYADSTSIVGTDKTFAQETGAIATSDWDVNLGIPTDITADSFLAKKMQIINQLDTLRNKAKFNTSTDGNIYVLLPGDVFDKIRLWITGVGEGDTRGLYDSDGRLISGKSHYFSYAGYIFLNIASYWFKTATMAGPTEDAYKCYMLSSDSFKMFVNPVIMNEMVIQDDVGILSSDAFFRNATSAGMLSPNMITEMQSNSKLDMYLQSYMQAKGRSMLAYPTAAKSFIRYVISKLPSDHNTVKTALSDLGQSLDYTILPTMTCGLVRTRPHFIVPFTFRPSKLVAPATPFSAPATPKVDNTATVTDYAATTSSKKSAPSAPMA